MSTRRKITRKSTKEDFDINDSEFKELWHEREVIIERLDRFITFLENESSKSIENIDKFQIECRLKSVEENFSEFDKIQTRLEFLNKETKNDRLETESLFYNNISHAKKLIAQVYEISRKQSGNAVSGQLSSWGEAQPQSALRVVASSKLPDLNLPTFHGKYESWYSFKDVFKSVVDSRQDVSEINKLLILKSCLKDDAANLIESLELIETNYTIAWDILNQRYDHKRAIINTHVNAILFNLPSVNRESPVHLRKLLDTLHQHLSALEKLKMPIVYWDTLLIPIILQKIDDRTKKEWESKQTDQNKMPALKELKDFLTKKCFTMEAISCIDQTKKSPQINLQNYNVQKQNFQNSYQKRVSCPITQQNHFDNTAQQNQNLSCYSCNQNHFLYQCPTFLNMPLIEKYNEINKNKLCSNCLRPGHSKSNCFAKGCKKCNLKHNSALHVDNYRPNSQNLMQNNNFQNQNNVSNNFLQNQANVGYRTNSTGNNVSQQNTQPIHGAHSTNPGNPHYKGLNTRHDSRSEVARQPPLNSNARSARANIQRASSGAQPTMCVIDQNTSELLENSENYLETEINADIYDQRTFTHATIYTNQCLLSTATVLILNNQNAWVKCNALLDNASQSNLMSQNLCEKLNLTYEKINIPLSGVGQIETKIIGRTITCIKSRFNEFQRISSKITVFNITESHRKITVDRI